MQAAQADLFETLIFLQRWVATGKAAPTAGSSPISVDARVRIFKPA